MELGAVVSVGHNMDILDIFGQKIIPPHLVELSVAPPRVHHMAAKASISNHTDYSQHLMNSWAMNGVTQQQFLLREC